MQLYKEILARFPRGGLSYVFAYGSAVKQQLGYATVGQQQNNVIDLIFCVRDTLGWHAENMDRHPSHYSAMRFLGPRNVMLYQEKLGAGVYFNTLVPLDDVNVTVKYGVVTRESLIEDLLEWRYLYLAGRLQKPVLDVVPADHDVQLSKAIHKNLLSAFQVALLLLPEYFTDFQLFHAISNLSYKGDFRMIFGENKQKASNIVQAQLAEFFKLYEPAMRHFAPYVAVDFNAKEAGSERKLIMFEQDKSETAKEFHLRHVPSELQQRIIRNAAFRGSYANIIEQLSHAQNLSDVVQMSVNDIVWRSSIAQSIKNIPSAGLYKSVLYSYRKALKTFVN